jgi:hypothetical protein
MAQQEFPLLNGVEPSWADASIKFTVYDGETISSADIAGLDVSDSLDIGVTRGTGAQKRKRTTGQEDNECTLKLYRSGYRALVRAIMAKAPTRNGQKQVGLVLFDIFYDHTPPGETDIFKLRVLGCRIAGRSFSGAEGSAADQVEVPVNCMKIVEIIDGEEVVLV